MNISEDAIAALIERAYIAAPGATLRREDRKKVVELAGLLRVMTRVLPTTAARALLLVDAAAGKGYVGVATAALVLAARGQRASVVAIERDPGRVAATAHAFASEAPTISFVGRPGEVEDATCWPEERPDLVVALHACGAASDAVVAHAARLRAKHVLIAPCCVAAKLPAAMAATAQADAMGLPRHAEIRRPFVESLVLAGRVRSLEAAGYEVMVDGFVPPTVTPYNKLLVARWIGAAAK